VRGRRWERDPLFGWEIFSTFLLDSLFHECSRSCRWSRDVPCVPKPSDISKRERTDGQRTLDERLDESPYILTDSIGIVQSVGSMHPDVGRSRPAREMVVPLTIPSAGNFRGFVSRFVNEAVGRMDIWH
jgi:hypothetical protein